jgi:hypothetical protein
MVGKYPKSLDITPLFSCPKLTRFNLETSDHREDLFPERIQLLYRPATFTVAKGINHRADYLAEKQISTIIYRESVREIHPIAKRIAEDGLDKVRELVKILWTRMNKVQKKELQIVVMSQLGLSSYCAVDIDVSKIFDEIPDDANLEQVQSNVNANAFPLLEKHLRQGKTSIFLDIGVLEGPELEELIPTILKQRKEELEQVRVITRKMPRRKHDRFDKEYYDVRYLWLTAYGFQVLSELGRHSLSQFQTDEMMRRFNRLGYELRFAKRNWKQIPKGMSSTLRDCIWKMIENETMKDMNFSQILVPPSQPAILSVKKKPEIGKTKKPGPLITVDDVHNVELEDVLARFPEAKVIGISGLDIDEIDLSRVASPSLLLLFIEDTSLTNIDLSPLSTCDWLMIVKINHNKNLRNIDLTPLAKCERLRDLYLYDNLLDDVQFSQLRGCKKLLRFEMANNPSRNLFLDDVGEIENLRILSIGPQNSHGPEIWTVDLSPLFESHSIRSLYIPDYFIKLLIDSRYRESYERVKWRKSSMDDFVEFY